MATSFTDPGQYTTITFGKKTVTTAGTRVQLSTTSTGIRSVAVKALASNTTLIYVGDVTVASTNGFQLAKGESVSLPINNLNKIYLDCDTSGEGVTYIAT